ncbi:MAG: C40 family peptidase [Candidatus Aquicultorales bacterium]
MPIPTQPAPAPQPTNPAPTPAPPVQTPTPTTPSPSNPNPAPAATPSTNAPSGTAANSQTALTPEAKAKQEKAKKLREKIEQLGMQIGAIVEAYNGASLDATRTAQNLEKAKKKIYWFESELQAQRQQVNSKVVHLYKNGQADPLEVIVNSSSFHDFVVKFSLLLKVGESDADLLDRIQTQKRKLEEARFALKELQEAQNKTVAVLKQRKEAVLKKLKEYEALLKSIDADTQGLLNAQFAVEKGEQAALKARFLGSDLGSKVVSIAMQFLGMPYIWGGENPEIGFDCSGLTRYVYLQFGIDMPHWVPSQWEFGVPVAKGKEKPGDLVFFNDLNHMGIYVNDGYFIHAPRTGDYIKLTALSSRKDYMGARRLLIDVPGD